MPVLRFTRDKRGYEHFQLVQPGANRRGTEKPRILYWFRSPPNVRVGCKPFDDAVRAAVERHNPDLEFDWTQILATPIPSAEAERWRERRRQERAARQAAADDATAGDEPEGDTAAALEDVDGSAAPSDAAASPAGNDPGAAGAAGAAASSRRARRRRRGRRRPAGTMPAGVTRDAFTAAEPPKDHAHDADDAGDDAAPGEDTPDGDLEP